MSTERVVDDARRITGLDDFGAPDFAERLALLLAEVEADDNVWKAHKAQFVEHCVNAAANRLRIQHYWTEHPGALDVEIDRPIDVVALPRSGSTHLENLLAADRRLRHLPVYSRRSRRRSPAKRPGPTASILAGPAPPPGGR